MAPFKYITIAQKMISDIQENRVGVGEKLPSLRHVMQLYDVSMTTALASYRFLENSGYAVPERKRGYFAQQPFSQSTDLQFPQFKTQIAAVSYKSTGKEFQSEVISFSTAKLDPSLVDRQLLNKSLISVLKSSMGNLDYENPQGNQQLRNQLAYHFSQQGFATHQQELVITNGCMDATALAVEVVSKTGDIIAISSPCYAGSLNMLASLGRRVVEIPSTAEGIDLMQLESLLKAGKITACVLTANHQNPTGHCLSNDQKQRLANLAKTYQTPIIEDDVFREVSFTNSIPLPIKYFDDSGWVLWCNSFSKTLAPGLRLGWCIPGRYLDAFLALRKYRTLGVNQPMQLALADYLSKGHYKRHLKRLNLALSAHMSAYLQILRAQLPPQSQIHIPSGGMVLWLRIPGLDADALTASLNELDIRIQPGSDFSTTDLYLDCIRLNLGISPDDCAKNQLELIIEQINHQLSER